MARFVLPAATSRRTSSSRAVRPPAGPALRAPRRAPQRRARSGAAPSCSEDLARGVELHRRAYPRRRAPGRRARSGPVRAPPRTARRGHATRSTPGAARAGRLAASPSASSTAPSARAAMATSSGAPNSSAIRASSSAATRAAADVAGGQHDLDVAARAAAAAVEAVPGLVDRAANGGGRGVGPGPGPAAARPAPAPAAGPSRLAWRYAVFGLGELAPQPVELGRADRSPRRAIGSGSGSASRSLARRASAAASCHAPWNCMSSARFSRHCPRNCTSCGWDSHQRSSAAVHSWARRRSKTCWHDVDHASSRRCPTMTGDTSPAVTETIASSMQREASRGLARARSSASPSPEPRQDQQVRVGESCARSPPPRS